MNCWIIDMRVLVACEYSATVRDAFRALGHDAWSCDILPTDGDPRWHIEGDALEAVYGGHWDLMIAHPPCTYMTNAGVTWLHKDPTRWAKLDEGAAFFKALWDAPIERIAIENPVMHKYAKERHWRDAADSDHPAVSVWTYGAESYLLMAQGAYAT
jgi:hypothetical protein